MSRTPRPGGPLDVAQRAAGKKSRTAAPPYAKRKPPAPSANGDGKGPHPAEVAEAPDNPHRLAARFLDHLSPLAGPPYLLRHWRGEFHRWGDGAYRPAPDGDVRAEMTEWIRSGLRLNRVELAVGQPTGGGRSRRKAEEAGRP